MMSGRDFSITVDINAPPEIVAGVMFDVERWAEWTPSVSRIERLDSGPLAVGCRARILQPKVPPAVWQVTELEPGRGFSWKSGSALAWAVGKHGVEASGAGSRATLSLHFGGPLGGILARLLRNLNNRYLGMEAAGLKRRSESLAYAATPR
jgi:hypothetical protein